MRRKLLFFDIDGTVVTSDHVVPESTRSALASAKDRGNLLFVNTGRPFRHIEPQIKKLPFDGFICSLGGHIVFRDSVLCHTAFTKAQCAAIRDMGLACGMTMIFESEEAVYFHMGDAPRESAQKEYNWLSSIGVPAYTDLFAEHFCFDKFVCWPKSSEDAKHFCDFFSEIFSVVHREHGMLEITCRGISKATGMHRLMDFFSISAKDTFAFGDGANDLPMLREAGTSVLMGNAPKELWTRADYVTDTIERDGLYNAMRQFDLV